MVVAELGLGFRVRGCLGRAPWLVGLEESLAAWPIEGGDWGGMRQTATGGGEQLPQLRNGGVESGLCVVPWAATLAALLAATAASGGLTWQPSPTQVSALQHSPRRQGATALATWRGRRQVPVLLLALFTVHPSPFSNKLIKSVLFSISNSP
jgi:hypothetical protein